MRRCTSAQTERGNLRGGATKKRKISRTSLPKNLYFSVFNEFSLSLSQSWPGTGGVVFCSREGPLDDDSDVPNTLHIYLSSPTPSIEILNHDMTSGQDGLARRHSLSLLFPRKRGF